MTPALRKYHRHVWTVLALVLPALFVAAIFAIPNRLPAPPQFNAYQPEALPEILKTVEKEDIIIHWRENNMTGEQQLEIILKKPLTVPSAFIYMAEKPRKKPEESILLGSLNSTGTYRFNIDNLTPKYVLIFDQIKNQNLYAIAF